MAREAASSSAGPGDKTRITGPPVVLALSPEQARCPGSLRRFLSGS
jgi:hypothetical protein